MKLSGLSIFQGALQFLGGFVLAAYFLMATFDYLADMFGDDIIQRR